MGTNGHLDLDTGGKSVDQKVYRSMIGSLLYLCASRPDIMLSVCMCARFQSDPKESHLTAVKRILRYLAYTPKFGLWYPRGSTFDLIGYSDADWAGCKINRKSTSGTCQFLGRSLVSWASKKQNSVALSTAEVHTQPIKRPSFGFNKGAKWEPKALWSGSTGLSGVHRTVSGAPEDSSSNSPTLGISGGTRAIIHRTVRCTPDSVRCAKAERPQELASFGNRQRLVRYNSPDCPVCTGLSGATTEQRLSPRQRLPAAH
jgi:hypothetical protein